MRTNILNVNKKWDIIFAIGLVLTTMTNLRFYDLPIGFGEMILLGWLLFQWAFSLSARTLRIDKKAFPVLLFWFFLILLQLFGSLVGIARNRFQISPAIHNLIAYGFSFLVCLTLSLKDQMVTMNQKIKTTVSFGIVIFFILLVYAKLIDSRLFGISLMYGSARFSGGANNPNQLALFVSTLPMWSLHFLSEKKYSNKKKLYWFLLFASSIIIGLFTGSDAIYSAWILIIALAFIRVIGNRIKMPFNIIILLTTFIVGLAIILLSPESILHLLNKIKEIDRDRSRLALWRMGLSTGLESPVVGYGFGAGVNGFGDIQMEAHNTYIDLFIQAGSFGVALLLMLIFRIYYSAKNNIYSLLSMFCIFVYAGAHLVIRQPIFWVNIMFLLGFRSKQIGLDFGLKIK